jgi:hypothetical protein
MKMKIIIIIIMLPNQAIASTPSAPRPSGAEGEDEDESTYDDDSLCRSLAGLTLLKDLSIITGLPAAEMPSGSWLAADDVRALTVLTGLTRLVLVNRDGFFQSQVGDSDVVALVCSLVQLRELELESRNTCSAQRMAVIGQLTQLTRLRLAGNAQWPDEASQKGLLLLSGLSSLRRLVLCSVEEVSGVLNSLRASLPEARVQWCKWVDEFEEWRRH